MMSTAGERVDLRIVQALMATVSWIFLMVAICGLSLDFGTMRNTAWAQKWTWETGDESTYANLLGICSNFKLHCRRKHMCECAAYGEIEWRAPRPLFYGGMSKGYIPQIIFMILGVLPHCHSPPNCMHGILVDGAAEVRCSHCASHRASAPSHRSLHCRRLLLLLQLAFDPLSV